MADKNITIKSASDVQLRELIIRLRQEREVQELIGGLKRAGTPSADSLYTDYAVSTETPITDLYHEDVDKVLAHYGILGMKWGIRRPRGKDGLVTGRGIPTEKFLRKNESPDKKAKREMKEAMQNRRQLSDEDIIKAIGRLEKEKRLRELTKEELNAGHAATNKVLLDIGTRVATTVGIAAAVYGVRAALQKKFDPLEFADALKPKK